MAFTTAKKPYFNEGLNIYLLVSSDWKLKFKLIGVSWNISYRDFNIEIRIVSWHEYMVTPLLSNIY